MNISFQSNFSLKFQIFKDRFWRKNSSLFRLTLQDRRNWARKFKFLRNDFGVKIHFFKALIKYLCSKLLDFFGYSFFERSSTVFQSCLSSFVIRLFVKSKTCWDTTSQIIRACVAFLMTPRVSKSCQIKMTSIHEFEFSTCRKFIRILANNSNIVFN